MGAQQSNSAAAAGVGLCGSQNQPPTTVEMSDGRVVSFDEYLQQSSDRYIPVKAPRKSRVGDWASVIVAICARLTRPFRLPLRMKLLLPPNRYVALRSRLKLLPHPLNRQETASRSRSVLMSTSLDLTPLLPLPLLLPLTCRSAS